MEYRTVRELCELVVDCPHSTPTWTDAGKIVLRNQYIKNGRIDLSAPSYTDEEHYVQRIKRAKPKQGDIVITREAPIGDVGMIPANVDCCLGQHLIISGECAEQLADMASQIVTGRDCVKVYVADHASVTDVIKEINAVPHDCICFLNGLEQNHNVVKDVMRHFSDSHFIITTPYCESLTMEPAGLFTTFFPVCSEEFCVSTSTLDIDAFCCKTDLRKIQHNSPDVRKLRSIRANQAPWFANGFFAPMLVERCARLQYEMKSMLATTFSDGDKESKAAMLNLVFVPLMRCLHRKDVLSAQIAEFDILDETRKKRLLAFAGVEKE